MTPPKGLVLFSKDIPLQRSHFFLNLLGKPFQIR